MSEPDTFKRILALLQKAALDDIHWSTVSALIDDALHAHGHSMVFGDARSVENIEIYSAGIYYHGQRHRELEREYFEAYYPVDERVPRVCRLPDSQLAHNFDLYSAQERRTSAVYNEFSPRVHAQNSITARMDGPDNSSIVWFVHDPVNGDGWSSSQLDSIRRLLPHIRQYVGFRQALASAGALGVTLTKLLDATGLGIIQIDRRGRISKMNDRARDLVQTQDTLFDKGGFLFARTPEDDARLQGLLRQALPPFGAQGVAGSMIIRRMPAPQALLLHVNPVYQQDTGVCEFPIGALVLAVDPAARTRIDPVMAEAALGLTEMESRVAALLAEGMSVREIAAATGRMESTIRTHMKHMLAKHDLTRQAELVRLVLRLSMLPSRET